MIDISEQLSSSPHADSALHALGQALNDRSINKESGLIHHSDRGVQYVSIRYAESFREVGNVSPAELESVYYQYLEELVMTA